MDETVKAKNIPLVLTFLNLRNLENSDFVNIPYEAIPRLWHYSIKNVRDYATDTYSVATKRTKSPFTTPAIPISPGRFTMVDCACYFGI